MRHALPLVQTQTVSRESGFMDDGTLKNVRIDCYDCAKEGYV